jgi:hypothetical protein
MRSNSRAKTDSSNPVLSIDGGCPRVSGLTRCYARPAQERDRRPIRSSLLLARFQNAVLSKETAGRYASVIVERLVLPDGRHGGPPPLQ